ncbi:MAG: class I SAM-dependent methyltransferase [Clostridia bacterium]|nr:class I SAM-dependent methyltransferase [Clostridia bacterium]MBQ1966053.1 class I SAM-dependent methyltransferase [Clostridia bacterium]MBQ5743289.1 class I SAM-dependent methyltransferase [Clostridia bacterium]
MNYDAIARDYDRFNSGFDYQDYLSRILPYLTLPKEPLALDCGCGTGELMLELSRRGFDCSGVDVSDQMLQTALEKLTEAGVTPHLMCQSLPEIDLYGAYHAVFSSMDTVNHLLDKRDVKRFFRRLYHFTEPGGYFIFDLKDKSLFSDTAPQIDEVDGSVLILQKSFDGTYACQSLTVFHQEGETYSRAEEEIWERWYDAKELRKELNQIGFVSVKTIPYHGRKIIIVRRPL